MDADVLIGLLKLVALTTCFFEGHVTLSAMIYTFTQILFVLGHKDEHLNTCFFSISQMNFFFFHISKTRDIICWIMKKNINIRLRVTHK